MAVDKHYENFPVASLLVPSKIRHHVVAIYRFARHADDVADEGDADAESRLLQLAGLRADVEALFQNKPVDAPTVRMLAPLRDAGMSGIDAKPFLELLSAFSQDVHTLRYNSYAALEDYCRRSANPVGRLVLALSAVRDAASVQASDRICTSLQLINFWQDAAIDAARGRIYVPQEDFAKFNVYEDGFPQHPQHQSLMRFQCERARALMLAGAPLLGRLRGRLRLEIAFTIAGGLRILERIENNAFDVRRRPKLRWHDSPRLLFLALRLLLNSGRSTT
jgi:squalene synthase HpnC